MWNGFLYWGVRMALAQFISSLQGNLPLCITVILILSVVFVNGWTDAPNAIATCVATKSMGVGRAIAMAAVCNFFGVLVMTAVTPTVAQTVFMLVNFNGTARFALIALCAAMVAIVLWAVAAWAFGIPTSESHALIAGLTGAAIALEGGFSCVNISQWKKVIYGLIISSLIGAAGGFFAVKTVEKAFVKMDYKKSDEMFRHFQIFTAGIMAALHGAQDGQKFIGVFMLGVSLVGGSYKNSFDIPLWLMLLCSVTMALGTCVGGRKIIKSVGMDMVKLEKYRGFSADIAAAAALVVSCVFGLPVSTTHTKTFAVIGAGAAKNLKNVNWKVAVEMCLAWVLTFPGCAVAGWITALIFLRVM